MTVLRSWQNMINILNVSREKAGDMMGMKHAWIHMWAESRKTILKTIFYCIIFTAFFTVAFIALSSENQVKQVRQNLANALQVKKISIDGDYLNKNGSFTDQEIEKLKKSRFVKDINTISNSFGNIQDVSPYIREGSRKEYDSFQKEKNGTDQFTFFGVLSTASSPMFSAAGYELVKGDGLKPEDENQILISNKVAAANHLNVGDQVVIETGRIYMRYAKPEKVTIKGIFECPDQEYTDSYAYVPYWQGENQVFVTQSTLTKMNETNHPVGLVYVYLKDGTQAEAYIREMKEKLGETVYDEAYFCNMEYVYTRNEEAYRNIIIPLVQIQDSVMVMAVIIGGGMLFLVVMLCSWYLKGKNRQIGIQLAMGEKRSSVFVQVLFEELFPILVAILCAVAIAFLATDKVSEKMLEGSVSVVNEQLEDKRTLANIEANGNDTFVMTYDLSAGEMNYLQVDSNVHTFETLKILWKCIALGIGIISITTGIQVWVTIKKKPVCLLHLNE